MSGADVWVVVPNWARFQHYGNREPVWIKLYVELMGRDEWLHLTLTERGLMSCIWLEYVLRRGQLRTSDIPAAVLQRVPRRYLDSLQAAGFIELSASRPPKLARSGALDQRKRKKEEVRTPLPPQEVGVDFFTDPTNPRAAGTNPRAVAKNDRDQVHQQLLEHARQVADGWDDGGSDVFDERLDQLEMEHHDQLRALERDDLWQKAFHQ